MDDRSRMPDVDISNDLAGLRVLAHPLRLKILGELRRSGPGTSSSLGESLGLSSGATSYHLRALADGGFIVEDVERGTKRERWWRAAHRMTHLEPSTPDMRPAAAGYQRAVARVYADNVLRYADGYETLDDEMGPAWARSSTLSDLTLVLTAAQAEEVIERVSELLEGYLTDAPADGALPFVVQYQVIPRKALQ